MQDVVSMKFEAMPQELLQFVGMDEVSELSNYNSYFGMIYTLVLIAVSIFAATFASGLILKEEKSKSIEFLNSLAISRVEIYVSKHLTYTIGVGIVLTLAVLSAIVCGYINGGETFVLMDILAAAKITSFTALFFGSISFMLVGVSPKIGTGAVGSGIVLISYMIGYLGELLGEQGEALLYLSPFITFSIQKVIAMKEDTVIALAIYLVIYVLAFFIGCRAYQKRDLQI